MRQKIRINVFFKLYKVYTSDVSGAGSDANVFVVLYGRDGSQTEPTSLCPKKDERKSRFNKKSVDTVSIHTYQICLRFFSGEVVQSNISLQMQHRK